jgi:hypothetical protein
MLNVVIDHLAIHRLDTPASPPAAEDILYLVLHGLVSIVQFEDKFHLYLIDMEDDHRYLGGTFLSEQDIPRGTSSELVGVSLKGGAELDPSANPVLKLDALPPVEQPRVNGVIVVPRPRKLYSLDRGTVTVTSGADKLVAAPKTLSGVRVLEYGVPTGFAEVAIQGKGFEYRVEHFSKFPNGARVAAVQIYDMPGGEVGPDHQVREFSVGSTVLGAPIEIDEAVTVLDPQNDELPPGLSKLELAPLDSRSADVSAPVLDFIRLAEWNPTGSVTETCRSCCGAPDGKVH